ncbi:helix-turn-helix domain-containing protein [Streptococcus caprae]|uniref:Helix-turn-helix domain-containing protein n=1 Tax=Streptococcus caprae TaxID=1640501 RepID=A0ABV8CSD1_9STRE
MKFGEKLRQLRESRGLTREFLCGNESQLSIRQLARIEAGTSIPTLPKLLYLSQKLGISLDELADEKDYQLPKRYLELKFLIIRTATYGDPLRLEVGDRYFDEIFQNYYAKLPEDEQLAVDCLQARWDVHISDNVNFGLGILNDYFAQVLKRVEFSVNDLLLIDLYLLCTMTSVYQDDDYDFETYQLLMERLLHQGEELPTENLYVLNNVLLNSFHLAYTLKQDSFIEGILTKSQELMVRIQDFQKKPIWNLFQWKLALKQGNNEKADQFYKDAILFSRLIGDEYLGSKLDEEWVKDNS